MTEANEIIAMEPQDIAGVRALVETIRTADLGSVRTLAKILVRLNVPDMLPIMEDLLDDNNADLSLTAYDWFANTSNERATAILVRKLEDSNRSENERELAAEALGRRGDTAALVPIERVAETFVATTRDSRELCHRLLAANLNDAAARLLVLLAVAEAKLGGDGLAAIPIIFARTDANVDRDPIVRIQAVNALASVAAGGTFDVLRSALLAEDNEIVEGAIWALQLIGAREAVDALVAMATPERLEVGEIALTAVVAVTGPGPGMGKSVYDLAPDQLSQWWQTKRLSFRSGICYRCGNPITLGTFVELLRDRKQRPYVANELRVIAGFDCGFDVDVPTEQQDSVVSTAEHWVATAGAGYKTGALYKYGRERNLSEAVRVGIFVDS